MHLNLATGRHDAKFFYQAIPPFRRMTFTYSIHILTWIE